MALVFLVAGAAAASGAACVDGDVHFDVCSDRAPLVASPILGTSLADKQIALTFDDGPGDRTVELSQYLAGRGIRAVFFVTGRNLAAHPGVLAQLRADGHLVANHTQNHPDLTTLAAPAIVSELTQADALIGSFVDQGHFLFRAPYGAWNASVYAALAPSPMNKYVGAVGWDIGNATVPGVSGADWDCWQNLDYTTAQCGDLYLAEITTKRRGITLMHDPFGTATVGRGHTVDMVKYLVPRLTALGFTFVRADEVPAIAAFFPKPPGDAGIDAPRDGAIDAVADAHDAVAEADVATGSDASSDAADDADDADAGQDASARDAGGDAGDSGDSGVQTADAGPDASATHDAGAPVSGNDAGVDAARAPRGDSTPPDPCAR